jgi:hypothetical protein
MRRYKWIIVYDIKKVPYFLTVYTKKELKFVKTMLKEKESYKIVNKEPFIGW